MVHWLLLQHDYYTGCYKSTGTAEYLTNGALQKMFEAIVVWFRGGHKTVPLV